MEIAREEGKEKENGRERDRVRERECVSMCVCANYIHNMLRHIYLLYDMHILFLHVRMDFNEIAYPYPYPIHV